MVHYVLDGEPDSYAIKSQHDNNYSLYYFKVNEDATEESVKEFLNIKHEVMVIMFIPVGVQD